MNLSKQKGYTLVELVFVLALFALLTLGAIGWVLNIIKLVELANQDSGITVMMIARAAGTIVAPLGAVLGYL